MGLYETKKINSSLHYSKCIESVEKVAEHLMELKEFKKAKVIKENSNETGNFSSASE